MRSVNVISAERVVAMLIEAGEIQSLNYTPGTPPYSGTGTRLDLTTGAIESPNFAVDAAGNVSMTGGAMIGGTIVGGDVESINYVAGAGTPPYSSAGTRLDLTNGNLYTRGLVVNAAANTVDIDGRVTARALTIPAQSGPDIVAAVALGGYGLKRDHGGGVASEILLMNSAAEAQMNARVASNSPPVATVGVSTAGGGVVGIRADDTARLHAPTVEIGVERGTSNLLPYFVGPNTVGGGGARVIVAFADWDVTVTIARKHGSSVYLHVLVQRTGANIGPTVGNNQVATLGGGALSSLDFPHAVPLIMFDASTLQDLVPCCTFNPNNGNLFITRISGTWINGATFQFAGEIPAYLQ